MLLQFDLRVDVSFLSFCVITRDSISPAASGPIYVSPRRFWSSGIWIIAAARRRENREPRGKEIADPFEPYFLSIAIRAWRLISHYTFTLTVTTVFTLQVSAGRCLIPSRAGCDLRAPSNLRQRQAERQRLECTERERGLRVLWTEERDTESEPKIGQPALDQGMRAKGES